MNLESSHWTPVATSWPARSACACGVGSVTGRHMRPLQMADSVLACYNSDNYVTNASKDKGLSSDVDGSRARPRREMVAW